MGVDATRAAAGTMAPGAGPMRVVGILLAAGRGSRFGGDKLLAPLPGPAAGLPPNTPVGVAAALHLLAALPESVAVVRRGDESLAALLRDAGMRIVQCPSAGDGMGSSLAHGVRSTPQAGGWVIALADMPWIAPGTIARVAGAVRAGADIAAPAHLGRRGHPVGFARRHYAALAALAGDEGARTVIAGNAAGLVQVDVADAGILADVDRPQDLPGTPNERDASAV